MKYVNNELMTLTGETGALMPGIDFNKDSDIDSFEAEISDETKQMLEDRDIGVIVRSDDTKPLERFVSRSGVVSATDSNGERLLVVDTKTMHQMDVNRTILSNM